MTLHPNKPLFGRVSTKEVSLPMKFKTYERDPDWMVYVAINAMPDPTRHCLSSTRQIFILEETAGQLTDDGFIGFLFLSEKLLFTSGGCSFSSAPSKKPKQAGLSRRATNRDSEADLLELDLKTRDFEEVELEFPDSRHG